MKEILYLVCLVFSRLKYKYFFVIIKVHVKNMHSDTRIRVHNIITCHGNETVQSTSKNLYSL